MYNWNKCLGLRDWTGGKTNKGLLGGLSHSCFFSLLSINVLFAFNLACLATAGMGGKNSGNGQFKKLAFLAPCLLAPDFLWICTGNLGDMEGATWNQDT